MTDPTIRKGKLSEFRTQSRNLNKHNARGTQMLEGAMRTDGFVAPITAAADGETLDGSLRLTEASKMFGDEVLVVEHDGT